MTTRRWWIAGILNANDAAATAKHTDLTAAKILFAQTAKGQDVLTDNDKALVERLRDGVPCCDPDTGNGEGSFYIDDANETMCEAADRIEAQAAEIERLREALEHIENYYGDGHRTTELARAALGETE